MDGAVIALAALGGLATGSFGNVVAYRAPLGRSVVRPRSACPACTAPIEGRDNVPLVSWLVLRGQCRSCAAPIPARYPAVELATGLLFAAVAANVGATAALPAFLVLAWSAVVLSTVDLEHRLVPRGILYPAAVVTACLLAIAAGLEGTPVALVRALVGAVVAAGALAGIHFAYPKAMGFGDVRLAGYVGLCSGWLGAPEVAEALFIAFLLGSVVGLGLVAAGRAGMRSGIPFAPFLCAGGLAAVLWGPGLTRLWLG